MSRSLLLTLVLLGAAFAGCAEEAATIEDDLAASDPALDHEAGIGTVPDETGAGDDLAVWHAHAYDRIVDPKGGASGRIQSYSFVQTNTEDGQTTEVSVDVEVLGRSTEAIRMNRTTVEADYTMKSEIVSTDVEVHRLRHTLTVLRDDSGERAEGETATITLALPADEVAAQGSFGWYFVAMDYETADGAGTWEYYMTEQMQDEMDEGGSFYLPYIEGEEATAWWGFEYMLGTYGLSWWSAWASGDRSFEEGSYDYGGYSYSASRVTHELGGYAFDGWDLRWGGSDGSSSNELVLKVAPELPMPLEYTSGSSDEGSEDLLSYRLTDLRLG